MKEYGQVKCNELICHTQEEKSDLGDHFLIEFEATGRAGFGQALKI
jgi:hypothetical protein